MQQLILVETDFHQTVFMRSLFYSLYKRYKNSGRLCLPPSANETEMSRKQNFFNKQRPNSLLNQNEEGHENEA